MPCIALEGPPSFDFGTVLASHGWSVLRPFESDPDVAGSVFLVLRTPKGAVDLSLSGIPGGLKVHANQRLTQNDLRTLRSMFRMDEDLSHFYALARTHGRAWIGQKKMGRLLRSQTVFEDLIKLILTTNCTWGQTKSMVQLLCQKLGEATPSGRNLFPSPEAIARKRATFFTQTLRAGYRGPYLSDIAKRVSRGDLDCEAWRTSDAPTPDVRKQILALPGAGPYVADNLLKLLGRYEALGIDSYVRAQCQKLWKTEKKLSDRDIKDAYEPLGDHRGLMLWCDVTST